AMQHAHAAHVWPPGEIVRVRIGIHTGEPTLEEGDYYGIDVHLAARLCEAAHGGQVLLSQSALDGLNGAVEARDLGAHELRGLPPRSAPSIPAPAFSCSRNTSSPRMPSSCSRRAPRASATC